MWASADRRVLIALAAMLIVAPLPLCSQEKKPPETYESAALKAAAAMLSVDDPYSAIGMFLLAGEYPQLEPWKFPMAENVWASDRGLEIRAALSMFGAGHPFGALGSRLAPTDTEYLKFAYLKNWQYESDDLLPINRHFRDAIRDNRLLPDLRIKPGSLKLLKPVLPEFERVGSPDWGWHQAYLEAIKHSHAATPEMFAKAAKPHEDVLFHNLNSNPRAHRGKVITVTGKLVVLRKEEAPRFGPDGLDHIYVGYVLGPTKGAAPFVIVLTQLPEGIDKPAENLNVQVTVHAYFLSVVRFPADKKALKKEDDVFSPYLVGKTAQVHLPPKRERAGGDMSFAYYIVIGSLIALVAIALFVAALNAWVRRGDQKTEAQLLTMRQKHQSFDFEPSEADSAPAPPVEAGVKFDGSDDAPKPPEKLG